MTYQKTVVVDFDGVLAEYHGWQGEDVFGRPMPYASDALKEFREWGWRIVIWTTRRETRALRRWLKDNDIPYDGINTSAHNPPDTNSKPIAEVYIDDRSWYDVQRKFSWVRVMRRLRRLYQPPKDTFIDDAALWSSPIVRLLNTLKRWWEEMMTPKVQQ